LTHKLTLSHKAATQKQGLELGFAVSFFSLSSFEIIYEE
jgi:hypothetical protein